VEVVVVGKEEERGTAEETEEAEERIGMMEIE
jgi:hypothetical protein